MNKWIDSLKIGGKMFVVMAVAQFVLTIVYFLLIANGFPTFVDMLTSTGNIVTNTVLITSLLLSIGYILLLGYLANKFWKWK